MFEEIVTKEEVKFNELEKKIFKFVWIETKERKGAKWTRF